MSSTSFRPEGSFMKVAWHWRCHEALGSSESFGRTSVA
jgi:hypothetical protein